MSNNILRLLFTIISILALHSQDLVSQTEVTKFVINRFGTPLMSKPDMQSDTLKMINPGVKISRHSSSQPDSVLYPDSKISLIGNWLKTDLNGASGYIFSADLSNNKPIVKLEKNDYEPEGYVVDILGQKMDSSAVIRTVEYSKDNFVDYTTNYYSYEHGKSEDYWFDGCWYQSFYIEGWNLSEAFQLIRN